MRELLSTLNDIIGREGVRSGKVLEQRDDRIRGYEPLRTMAIVRPQSTEEVAAVARVGHSDKVGRPRRQCYLHSAMSVRLISLDGRT